MIYSYLATTPATVLDDIAGRMAERDAATDPADASWISAELLRLNIRRIEFGIDI